MRGFCLLLCLLMVPLFVCGQNQPTRGIEVGDLNRSADPCNDFFEFANGAWRAANPIPASMNRWSRRWAAGDANKDHLKEILEQVSQGTNPKGSTEQLIGDFYGSCMDVDRINKQGIEPIKPVLDQIDAVKDAAGIQRMILMLHRMAIASPFGVTGTPDRHNPSMVMADFYASGLGMPDRDYYLKTEPRFQEARVEYRKHVAKMFELAGYDEKAVTAATDAVVKMETAFAEATLDRAAQRDPNATDHKITYAGLQKLAPHVNWKSYFEASGMSPKTDINMQQPKFFQEVDRQLQKIPASDWRAYLKWQLLNSVADSLPEDFGVEDWNFYQKYLSGAQEMKPRWKRCVESTDVWLGEALGKKYVEKYFPPAAKARMLDLVHNLLAAMHDDIESRPWMGAETKKKALEKLATFNPKIGYPDRWKDYSKVPISRDSYWANVQAGRKFAVDDDWSTIGKPTDRGRWGLTPPTSDAYYNPLLNEIVFPAGILQPPAFYLDGIDAINYGAIGVVIGHEITHGFDDSGAKFDAQGRLENWWTADDLKQFEERGACVADQFENYFIEEGVHHNGKLVLGESIADLGGVKLALAAYQKSLQGKPEPSPIDGFTPVQQFFIAWGQFRGDAIRPEQQRLMVQTDPHPIAKFRVIGPISNTPEFEKAFSCKSDAAMIRPPEKQCGVW